MIGVQRGRVVNWCTHNIDFLIVTLGAIILACLELFDNYLQINLTSDYGFWALLLGVITLSVGISAIICYRVLLRWHGFFSS